LHNPLLIIAGFSVLGLILPRLPVVCSGYRQAMGATIGPAREQALRHDRKAGSFAWWFPVFMVGLKNIQTFGDNLGTACPSPEKTPTLYSVMLCPREHVSSPLLSC
jgi:hypothetical protein